MKKTAVALGLIVLVAAIIWKASAPPSYYEPAPPRRIGEGPDQLVRADKGDVIGSFGVTYAKNVPGHDEVLAIPGTPYLLVSGRDEHIWRVDVDKQTAARFAETPLSPTGARMVPGSIDEVYFCMARLDYNEYERSPGLYLLNLKSGAFTELVTRVPITGDYRDDGLEVPNGMGTGRVIVHPEPLELSAVATLNEENSRPFQFCNDLDVSLDGQHVYLTEPINNRKASSGLGATPEAITLAPNGRVWRYDPATESIGLVIENIVFADGILIEYDEQRRETGLLITETVNFRIGRAHLAGEKSGQYEVLWDDLPGYPDGMDRDEQGRIWVGVIKDRTPLLTWVHRNPWIKPALLRIPPTMLPISKGTAILGLSLDASEIIAYSHHDGSRVRDISVVVPVGDRLYLPSFFSENAGIHFIPIEALLPGATTNQMTTTPSTAWTMREPMR